MWLQRLLGGRPMVAIGVVFFHRDAGKMVYEFIDCRGRMWMAYSPWSKFRVRIGYDYWDAERKNAESKTRR